MERDTEVATRRAAAAGDGTRRDTIPGVGRRAAEHIVAELGVDMSRFPTAAHAASWTGICPGNNESAGKRRSGTTPKGNRWLSNRAGGIRRLRDLGYALELKPKEAAA